MAKKNKTIDVSGMTIEQIMDVDLDYFNSLSERDLRAITSRLVSASNKRIRAIKKKGFDSPAVRSLGTKTAFSTKLPKGTDTRQRVNKLRQEFSRARRFLTMKTSTISGTKKYHEQIIEDIETGIGRKLSGEDIGRAFNLLHKAQERGIIDSKRGSKGSLQAREIIFDILNDNPDLDDDDLLDEIDEEYDEWYNEEYEDETEEIDFDDYFE